jgi:hypothetical protein
MKYLSGQSGGHPKRNRSQNQAAGNQAVKVSEGRISGEAQIGQLNLHDFTKYDDRHGFWIRYCFWMTSGD